MKFEEFCNKWEIDPKSVKEVLDRWKEEDDKYKNKGWRELSKMPTRTFKSLDTREEWVAMMYRMNEILLKSRTPVDPTTRLADNPLLNKLLAEEAKQFIDEEE